MLETDLRESEISVSNLVRVGLNQNQFDALVSFTFNLGGGALRKSTLLRRLNASDFAGASKEFPKWNHIKGKESQGLTNRRLAEQKLFLL